nr:integrase, catalytic region, zinc finger, CCHC-type, peptidase aspartic, catalytic [Tanacetum cinerariifolium]
MFRINPSKTSKEEKHVPNTVSAGIRTKPITVSQPHVITKKEVNSDLNGLSSTGVDNTKTRRPQPRSNKNHDRVPSVSKSSRSKNKEAEVEEHHRNLLLSKNNKHISSVCNNIQIESQDVISKVVCATCSKCLIYVKHDKCLSNYVNGKNSRGKKQKSMVSFKENQMKYQPKVTKPKKWGNILITRVYFVEGLGHNLFSVEQFCDSDLEVAFRRNVCFIRHLEGTDLLKGNRSTNLYTINLHEMASAWPICLMARASSTKSWLWHQRLSYLNIDTINDLARNDLVASSTKTSSKFEAEITSSSYGFVSKHEAPEVIIKFLKSITVLLRSPFIIIRTDNCTEFKNQVLKENFDTVGIYHQMSSVRTPQQNGVLERRNQTLVEAARTIKLDILFLHVFGALCYPKNDHEDIGKLGEKGDIGFFIGYSADSCAYRIYNRRTKKIIETMNVSFDELSGMAFEQSNSKPGLKCMTSGQISSGLDLTYAPLTITMQQPSEGDLDLLFEAMYDDYIGGQPSATARTVPPAQEPQVRINFEESFAPVAKMEAIRSRRHLSGT